jgi:hypothetical protein
MGMRFQRRIRILPWLYLNLGKGGFSISIGPRGAKLTIGKRGAKGSVGVPGTGIRYETPYYKPGGANATPLTHNQVNVAPADRVNAIPTSNMDKLRDLMETEARRRG